MHVLVPVMTCGVRYQIAEGRPYSLFERTLLEAVESDVCTLDALVELLGVNRSLIVHGLVTLVEAGWIALTSSKTQPYVLTKSGRSAVNGDQLPDTFKLSPEIQATVIVDRVWGNVCSSRDTRYVQDAEELDGPWIKLMPEMSEAPDPSEVRRFLYVDERKNQRVYSVGGVSLKRIGRDWIPVVVGNDHDGVFNIPRHWLRDTRLIADIREAAHRLQASLSEVDACTSLNGFAFAQNMDSQFSFPSHSVQPDEVCVLVGDEHDGCLSEILDEARQGDFVVIHSETLGEEEYSKLDRNLQRALISGANVDVLWGRKSSGHEAAMGRLSELERASLCEVPGRLLVSRTGTGLLANVVLASGDDTPVAFVGSHRWLDKTRGKTLSVRTTNKNVVAEICDHFSSIVAEFIRPSYNALRLESQARQTVASDSGPDSIRMGVVKGSRFLEILSYWLAQGAGDSITFGTRDWPVSTDSRMILALREWMGESGQVSVISGCPEGKDSVLLDKLREFRFEVRRHESLYAEFVRVGDDSTLIGSGFRWLDNAERGPATDRVGYGLWFNDRKLSATIDQRVVRQ